MSCLEGPEFVKSDHLTGPILCSAPLLGIDIWQEALDRYDPLTEAEVQSSSPRGAAAVPQRSQSRPAIYTTRSRANLSFSPFGYGRIRTHPATAQVESFLNRREQFGERSRIEQQERLFLWAQENEPDEIAVSDSRLAFTLPRHGRVAAGLGFATASGPARTTHPSLAGITEDFTRRIDSESGRSVSSKMREHHRSSPGRRRCIARFSKPTRSF